MILAPPPAAVGVSLRGYLPGDRGEGLDGGPLREPLRVSLRRCEPDFGCVEGIDPLVLEVTSIGGRSPRSHHGSRAHRAPRRSSLDVVLGSELAVGAR